RIAAADEIRRKGFDQGVVTHAPNHMSSGADVWNTFLCRPPRQKIYSGEAGVGVIALREWPSRPPDVVSPPSPSCRASRFRRPTAVDRCAGAATRRTCWWRSLRLSDLALTGLRAQRLGHACALRRRSKEPATTNSLHRIVRTRPNGGAYGAGAYY